MISLIVAIAANNVIGRDNQLPWRLPADLAYFKQTTQGHTVVMGRKTYESLGKPLPGRTNWILTRDKDFQAEGCQVFHSVDEVLKSAEGKEVFIIGGEKVYREFLPRTDRLFITRINESFEGDTYFPEILEDHWELTSSIQGEKNDKNPYEYEFLVYTGKL